MANEAAVASRSAGESSSVSKLAQFFPDAVPVRIPVRVSWVTENGDTSARRAMNEQTVIEYGTPQEVLFASSLPLEFEDKVLLENADGSLHAEAAVVAVQYHNGRTAVAARFTSAVANWIIKR